MMNPATQYSQDSSLALFGLLSSPFSFSPFSFSSFSFSFFSLSPSLSSLATITRRPACCSRKVWFVYFPVQSHNKIFPKIVGFEQTSMPSTNSWQTMQRHVFYPDKLSLQSSAGSSASHLGSWFDVAGWRGNTKKTRSVITFAYLATTHFARAGWWGWILRLSIALDYFSLPVGGVRMLWWCREGVDHTISGGGTYRQLFRRNCGARILGANGAPGRRATTDTD